MKFVDRSLLLRVLLTLVAACAFVTTASIGACGSGTEVPDPNPNPNPEPVPAPAPDPVPAPSRCDGVTDCGARGVCVVVDPNTLGCDCDSGYHFDGTCVADTACEVNARPLAGGISISRVDVFQSTAVNVALGDTIVSRKDFNAPIIAGRPAYIRVQVETELGFVPREIVLRARINGGIVEDPLFVIGGSTSDPATSFWLLGAAEEMISGGTFAFELLETTSCSESEGVVARARVPAAGAANLSAVDHGAQLRVVIVPTTIDGHDVPLTASDVDAYRRLVYAMYPLTDRYRVEVRSEPLRGAYDLTGDAGWSSWLEDCALLRESDGAPRNTFYYCVGWPGDSYAEFCNSSGCTLGLGYVPKPNDSVLQASVGIESGDASVESITFAHELGHNHGLGHAPCQVPNADPFPYAGGSIGVDGMNVMTSEYYSVADDVTDFMGYCPPNQWTSDYNYKRIFTRLAYIGAASAFIHDPYAARERITVFATPTQDAHAYSLRLGRTHPARARVPSEIVDATYLDANGRVLETVQAGVARLDHSATVHLAVPAPIGPATSVVIDDFGSIELAPAK